MDNNTEDALLNCFNVFITLKVRRLVERKFRSNKLNFRDIKVHESKLLC